jgi:hypothetical protein
MSPVCQNLPGVEMFARNLDKMFEGRKLLKIKIVNGQKLKINQRLCTMR